MDKPPVIFRALLNSKWFYSDSSQDAITLGANVGQSTIATFFKRFYNHLTLTQFTGFIDRNNVRIYQGDIIKWKERRYFLGKDKGLQTITFKSSVNWDDGTFTISSTQENDQCLMLQLAAEAEVIGNVFEHGHLIGKENVING